MTEPFRLIVADPPWKFKDKLPDTKGAEFHYPTLTRRELMRFPLPPIADDAVLCCWRVAALQRDALDVVDAWGFEEKTEFIWLKKTATWKRWFGMGRTLRAEHEVCIVATRGRPQVLNHSTRTTFTTDVTGFSAQVGRHSEKPEVFFKIVEALFPGPRLELFARRHRPGWTCLGDEVDRIDVARVKV
jgi:N6-adenosine-specific RNA methylase IME4